MLQRREVNTACTVNSNMHEVQKGFLFFSFFVLQLCLVLVVLGVGGWGGFNFLNISNTMADRICAI